MEVPKKVGHYKQQKDNQKLPHQFFIEVFYECKRVFDHKQFEFFSSFIIPNYTKNQNNSQINQSKNINLGIQKEDDLDINIINPNLFIQERRQNFYAQHNINQIAKQKHNRRILTTPTQKNRQPIKFTDYQSYCFYKTMQKQNKQEAFNKKLNKTQKMHSPQKIFYPIQNTKIPNTALFINRKDKYKSLNKKKLEWRKQNVSIQQSCKQTIPKFFIESLKSSRKFQAGLSYSKFPTSVR